MTTQEADLINIADKVIVELYEIEEKIDEFWNFELALLLNNALKEVIADLETDSVREVE